MRMRMSWCHRKKYMGKQQRHCVNMNKRIFNEKQKSYCTETDIEIIQRVTRTRVQFGIVQKPGG